MKEQQFSLSSPSPTDVATWRSLSSIAVSGILELESPASPEDRRSPMNWSNNCTPAYVYPHPACHQALVALSVFYFDTQISQNLLIYMSLPLIWFWKPYCNSSIRMCSSDMKSVVIEPIGIHRYLEIVWIFFCDLCILIQNINFSWNGVNKLSTEDGNCGFLWHRDCVPCCVQYCKPQHRFSKMRNAITKLPFRIVFTDGLAPWEMIANVYLFLFLSNCKFD